MNMKVSELREYLKVKHGEEFPSKFTKTQLQLRLAELEGEEKMFAKAGKSRTPLRQMEVALNQASKKKSDLQRHVQQELGLTISGNETIDQLKIKGLAKAYELAPPTAEDVGFGEHAGLTYEEVIRHHPQYVQWAVQTMKEGQCSPKLKRLAKWAEALELQPVEASKAGMGSKSKGYMKSEIKSGVSSSSSGLENLVAQLAVSVKQLTEEVKDIKDIQDRPRKKIAGDESFSTEWEKMSDIRSPWTISGVHHMSRVRRWVPLGV